MTLPVDPRLRRWAGNNQELGLVDLKAQGRESGKKRAQQAVHGDNKCVWLREGQQHLSGAPKPRCSLAPPMPFTVTAFAAQSPQLMVWFRGY